MDPHIGRYPLLSHLLHQSDPTSHAPPSADCFHDLMNQFPSLSDGRVITSLSQYIPSSLPQTLSLLCNLGPPADPETVSSARSKITRILQSELPPDEAEKEMEIYNAVVRLEELRDGYENRLREVEDSLVRAYASVVEDIGDGKAKEEVVRILNQAENGVLEKIDLSSRDLKFLPEAFGKIQGLISLNLAGNELTFIPDAIGGLRRLEELDLSYNSLQSLPDSIGLLLNLRILNVPRNRLSTLPESLAGCRSLVELDASFNNLTFLPANIGYGLQNLEKLSIQLNKIRYLPKSICEMRSIRYLDAHFNELHGLPIEIGRLTNLEVLNMSNNFSDLTQLPEALCDLTNLRELDLSNNQIRVLPDSFGRLGKLMKLNLDGNPLVVPPLEICSKGAEAVREFMIRRWTEILAAEQQQLQQQRIDGWGQEVETGWLSWGASMLSSVLTGASKAVGGSAKDPRDSYLDQQF